MNLQRLVSGTATVLLLAATSVGAAGLISPASAQAGTDPIRVLVVTGTHGFRHSEGIDASKAFLQNLGGSEFRFDITEDAGDLNAAKLADYDVLFLNNATLRIAPADPSDPASVRATRAGPRPIPSAITAEQQQAISEFVRSGNGFVATHSGVDAMYGWDEYREIVGGGLFREHPWTQEVQIDVEDPENPAVAHFGTNFRINDEIYVLDENPRENARVLLSLNMASTGAEDTSADHPISWIRRHGEGRVFVTVLGHFGHVWENPAYREHVLQGIRIAAGTVEADFSH